MEQAHASRPSAAAFPTLHRPAQLLASLMGLWLTLGLFVDGWAHVNRPDLETFFTPWHGLFYSGFAATAGAIVWTLRARGYDRAFRLGLAGVGIFGLGGLSDMFWHTFIGIEVNLEALLSPPHLLLCIGGVLMLSTPARAAWSSPTAHEPNLRTFFPTLLSVTTASAFGAFFLKFFWAFNHDYAAGPMHQFYQTLGRYEGAVQEMGDTAGIATFLLTALFLVGPVLLMMRRWTLPFGAVAFHFTVIGLLMGVWTNFESPEVFYGLFAVGLAADGLALLLRADRDRIRALRIFAVSVPLITWGTYFAVLALKGLLGWPPEFWGGVLVWTSLTGLGLALLQTPDRRWADAS